MHHTGHHSSSTTFANGLQPDRTRDPVPTATFADPLGATQATSQGATVTTAVADVRPAAAGGEGPPGILPDGPTDDNNDDRLAKSEFYRNARFTPRIGPQPPLVLDELPLRPFEGDVREYHEFRDGFLEMMELCPYLTYRQKLQHLLNYLKGPPLAMAEGYGLTDESYWDVLEMLEKQYGDNFIIRNTLIQDLASMPPPSERQEDLAEFLQKADRIKRRLKRCGADLDEGQSYCFTLMGQLPVQLRIKLIQSYGCRGITKVSCVLDGLRQYLSDIKEAEEHILPLKEPCNPADDPPVLDHQQAEHDESSAPHTLCERCQQDAPIEADVDSVAQPVEPAVNETDKSSDDRLKEIRACQLCNMTSHVAADCLIYPTIQKRLRRVLKLQICLLCLRGGHQAKLCPKRKKQPCRICGHGQHHRIVCKDAYDCKPSKDLRPSQMRTTTGPSGGPERSTRKRSSRIRSVVRERTSLVKAAIVRPGTQKSSNTRCKSTPGTNRKERTRNQGAGSNGQDGTTRSPTTSSDASSKQQTAKASRSARLLPARHGQLQTDSCSMVNESTKFRWEQREAEGDSSATSSGGNSDNQSLEPEDPSGSTALHIDAIYCASSTNEPTTLLECIKATAENPTTGDSREVLIFFDSGSTRSFVSMELACDRKLRRDRPCSVRVNTFGSELPTTIEGFATSIVLRSKHRRLPSLALTASDCSIPSIRTALVSQTDLHKLRRGELSLSPIQATPSILIGQDLVSHFKRRYDPTLPSGFYVVNSTLGPMLGGSGRVPTTVPVAATSSDATTPASVVHRSLNLTEGTPHSPKVPVDPYRKPSTTHSVDKGTDPASRRRLTQPVNTGKYAPPVAAVQDFSPPAEKNGFPRSTTSRSGRTKRHILSNGSERLIPSRKLTNPLDNSAPLPPLTTSDAVLRQGLPTGLNVLAVHCNLVSRRSHHRFQQNPALYQPKKTQLRRRSSSFGRRSVLGIKNHGELRTCETMRYLPDQLQTTMTTSTRAVPDETDPYTHYADPTPAEDHLPDVVLMAAETTSDHSGSEPTSSPDTSIRPHPGQRFPSAPARSHSDQWFPSPSKGTDPVPKPEHRPEPLRGNGTSDELPRDVPPDNGLHPTRNDATGNQQTNEAAKEPCREQTHRTAIPSATHQSKAATSAHGKPSSTPNGSYQHSTVTDDPTVNREQPPLSSTGRSQRELAYRRVSAHVQEGQPSRSARRAMSEMATHGPSIPIIDGFTSKSFAAFLSTDQDQAHTSALTPEDLPPIYKFYGCINQLGVPSSYLPPHKFQPIVPGPRTPLAFSTFDQLIQENVILPWKFILGSTLGTLPPYWEMMTLESYLHLHEEAQGATYRGMPICGIGPTGFFLGVNSGPTAHEYEGQRQTLLHVGRIARNTGKCLVLVIYDEPTTDINLHSEAIQLLCQEVQLSADHPIHLVTYRASADQLQHWLKAFPNVILGMDHALLSSLQRALHAPDKYSAMYVHAMDLQKFYTDVPLENLALHSGCPSPFPHGYAGHFQTPSILLKAAEAFEQLTGTPKDTLLEHSAYNLHALYHLNIDLPSRAITACKSPDNTEGLSTLHLNPGAARRADHTDQGILTPFSSSERATTHSVAPAAPSLTRVVTEPTYRKCTFCDNQHHPTECSVYPEVKLRMRRLQKLKRCFTCLNEGHPSKECPERITAPCRHCLQGHHHPALCRSQQEGTTVAPVTTHSIAPAASSPPQVAHPTCRICAFCDSHHPSTECTTFNTISQRLRRAEKRNLCLLCLQEGHKAATCPDRTTSTCQHCHRRHHPALCRTLLESTDAVAPTTLPTAAGLSSTKAAPDTAHPVAGKAGPTLRSSTTGTFPSVMNHFRRQDHPLLSTKTDPRVTSRSAKKRSAAVPTPAQAPNAQPSRSRSKRNVTKPPGTQLQVQTSSAAELLRKDPSTATKTSNKHRSRQKKRVPKTTHSVGKDTAVPSPHGEKTEHTSRHEKAHHCSEDPLLPRTAIASVTPVPPADARCELCAQHHQAERCTSFSTTEERRQRAQHLWLCFTCLDQSHRTEDCPRKGTPCCTLCGDDGHHESLCAHPCLQLPDRQQDPASSSADAHAGNNLAVPQLTDHRQTTEVAARVEHPTRAQLAEPFSTLVVVPAEALHQSLTPHPGETGSRTEYPASPPPITGPPGPELPRSDARQPTMAEDRRALPRQKPTMAEDRRALKRQNRETRK